jgi:hypothetical protein
MLDSNHKSAIEESTSNNNRVENNQKTPIHLWATKGIWQ